MRLHASQLRVRAKVVDLDTGRDLKEVIWVDESAGLCEAYQVGPDGKRVLTVDVDGAAAWRTVTLKGRFKLVLLDRPERAVDKIKMGAPACARCKSPLTLRGDDLCVRCKAKDRGKPLKDLRRLDPTDLRHKCERCSRDATWSSADEVLATPAKGVVKGGPKLLGGAYLFDQAAVVGRRYFCDWHHQPPRLLDDKGEVIKVDEESPHRPA
jgi:hypothetical protein